MPLKVSNIRTDESIGTIAEPDYTELEALLKAHYDAEEISFDRYDPLPDEVSVKVKTKTGVTIYEKVRVKYRNILQEANDAILGSAPFNLEDVVDVEQKERVTYITVLDNSEEKRKTYFITWGVLNSDGVHL